MASRLRGTRAVMYNQEVCRMGGLSSFLFFEIGAVYLSFSMTPDVKGPAFLFYYGFLWFILLAVAKWNNWKVLLPIIIYFSA